VDTAFEEETLDPKRQIKEIPKKASILQDVLPYSPEYNPAKLMGPNQWPSPDKCPSMEDCQAFQDVMNEYRSECIRVGFQLVRLSALAIGLDEHFFQKPLPTL
jgi:isopenicillin N synthase-like dioxygenase